jgi:hypothetical protein
MLLRGYEKALPPKTRKKHMKLSIETKVAAAVAVGFVALTIGAIAQEHSESGTGGPNEYAPANNPGLTHTSQQGYSSSLPQRTSTI